MQNLFLRWSKYKIVFWAIVGLKLFEVLILEKIPSVVQQFSQSEIWPYLLYPIVLGALLIHFVCFRKEYGSTLKTMYNPAKIYAIIRWIWFIPETVSIIVIFLSIGAIAYGIETIQFVKAVNNELIYGFFFVPLFDFYLFYFIDKKSKDPKTKLFSTIRKVAKTVNSKQIAISTVLVFFMILTVTLSISYFFNFDPNYFSMLTPVLNHKIDNDASLFNIHKWEQFDWKTLLLGILTASAAIVAVAFTITQLLISNISERYTPHVLLLYFKNYHHNLPFLILIIVVASSTVLLMTLINLDPRLGFILIVTIVELFLWSLILFIKNYYNIFQIINPLSFLDYLKDTVMENISNEE